MNCPYPDCNGQVTAGDEFCGECGRSLAPAALTAVLGSGAARVPPLPGPGPALVVPPPPPPPMTAGPVVPPPTPYVAPPVPTPAASNRLPLLIGGGVIILLVLFGLGAAALNGGPPATPTPVPPSPTPTLQTFAFRLADFTPATGLKKVYEVRAADGGKLGVLSANTGFNYNEQGSPELMGTIEIRVNNVVVQELAASEQPEYRSSNPNVEVVKEGRTYAITTTEGWHLATTIDTMTTDDRPRLANQTDGRQPVFRTLQFHVTVTPPTP